MQTETKTPKPAATSRKMLSAKPKTDEGGNSLEAKLPSKPPEPSSGVQIESEQDSACGAAPNASSSLQLPLLTEGVAIADKWSDEDENVFQAMLVRRKAAGFQRRGRDVSQQVLSAGQIAPNAGTVVATLVALVVERGTVKRRALVDAMMETAFSHPKARPNDRNWCQGYVAGAVRDGFLVAGECSTLKQTADVPR